MIFYFSATGNSKYVATRLAEATDDSTVSITECLKTQNYTFDTKGNERIGFVTPTYFWGLPSVVCDFLNKLELRLPDSSHSYIYHVATFGTTTGQVSHIFNELLGKRGLSLNGRFSVQMPDTWTPIFDLNDKEKIEKINHQAEKQIAEASEKIKQEVAGDFSRRKVPMALVKLYHPLYEKQRMTKYFTLEDSCIGCGL
jgi:flavodoxin